MIKKHITKANKKKTIQYSKKKNKCKTIKKNGKKNYKNSRKKSITQGGFRIKINDEDLEKFKNPHQNDLGHVKDCCPCVFSLFGMDDAHVRYYQELSRDDGLTSEKIVEVMKRYYPEYTHIFHPENIRADSLDELMKETFSEIPEGYGAIGGIQRQDGTKHCIAYGKSLKGDRYLFDVQDNNKHYINEQINEYFKEQKVAVLFMLNSYDAEEKLVRLNNIEVKEPMEIKYPEPEPEPMEIE